MRVFVHAYWQQNLGDDLFVSLLCQRYPDVLFYGQPRRRTSHAFQALPNFRRVPRLELIDRLLRRVRLPATFSHGLAQLFRARCDAVVSIGGSIFIEPVEWQQQAASLRNRFAPGKPNFVIGSNFGPYSDPQYLTFMKDLLAASTDICVRDRDSEALLTDLPNVRYAPDVVLSIRSGRTTDSRTAILSVIDLRTRPELQQYSSSYISKMVEISQACHEAGLEVVLMAFCTNENDHVAAEQVGERLEALGIKARHYVYEGDLKHALDVLSSATAVIGTRFHAIALAWAYGKRVLPISYSKKTGNVIQDLGFPHSWFKVEDINQLDARSVVRDLLAAPIFAAHEFQERAEQQFEGLGKFLSEHR